MPDSDESDRQEYYLGTIKDIVEEQKDFLGPEVALKQARRAPLKIDVEGNITGFYGTGEDALETLRKYTEHQEFYLKVIRMIVSKFNTLLGRDVSLKYARQAPLEIMPDGEIRAYYGKGRSALMTLVNQYSDVWGKTVAYNKITHALEGELTEEEVELLPEELRPDQGDSEGLIHRIISAVK